MADADDYSVGYGRPPKHSQFRKGVSGNPRGRPRGAKGLKGELKAELDEMVTITVEGRRKRVRKRRLLIMALAAKALKGHVAAADKLIALAIQAEGFGDDPVAKPGLSATDQLILAQFLGEAPIGDQTTTTSAASDEADK